MDYKKAGVDIEAGYKAMRLSGDEVDILMLAPKDALPLVEVPTPRWTFSEDMLLAISVILTQKTV